MIPKIGSAELGAEGAGEEANQKAGGAGGVGGAGASPAQTERKANLEAEGVKGAAEPNFLSLPPSS